MTFYKIMESIIDPQSLADDDASELRHRSYQGTSQGRHRYSDKVPLGFQKISNFDKPVQSILRNFWERPYGSVYQFEILDPYSGSHIKIEIVKNKERLFFEVVEAGENLSVIPDENLFIDSKLKIVKEIQKIADAVIGKVQKKKKIIISVLEPYTQIFKRCLPEISQIIVSRVPKDFSLIGSETENSEDLPRTNFYFVKGFYKQSIDWRNTEAIPEDYYS